MTTRQKRLERKRRKKTERRRELAISSGQRRIEENGAPGATSHQWFAASRSSPMWPPAVTSWPVLRAYVPLPDVWAATGLGTTGIVRAQPDGRYVAAFFMLELLNHGLKGSFGKGDQTPDEIAKMLFSLKDNLPPLVEGPVDLAATFAWGCRALGESEGHDFPAKELSGFYDLMPRPPGSARDWVDRLVGTGGLTPAGLVRVIRANPPPDDIPDGKEILIITEMTFAVADAGAAIDALQRAAPDIQIGELDGATAAFHWTRSYPKGHWSPLRRFGGRQILGSIRVKPGELVAEAKTLSMAAKLVDTLKRLLGDGIRLQSTRWTGMRELLAGGSSVGKIL